MFQRVVFLVCFHVTCTVCFLYLFVLFVLFTLDLMSRLPPSLSLSLWPECQFVIRVRVLDAVYFGLGRLWRSEQKESWSMVPSAAPAFVLFCFFILSIVILPASLLWDFFPFLFSFLSTHLSQPVCRFFNFFSLSVCFHRLNVIFSKFDEVQRSGNMISSSGSGEFCYFYLLLPVFLFFFIASSFCDFFSVHPSTKSIEHRCWSRVFRLWKRDMLLRSWKHTSLLLLLLLLLLLFFPAAQWGMRTGRCSVTIRAFVVSVLCRMNWGLFVDVEQLCGCGAERNWRNIFSVCQPAVSLPVMMHPSVLTLSVLCFRYHLNVCVCCSESGGARRGKAGQTGSLELEGMNFLHRRLGIHWSFRMFLCGAKTDFLRLL